MPEIDPDEALDGVAIIGMSCRVPGADDTEEFWQNLCSGVESIREFSDAELRAFGVEESKLRDPDFRKAGAVLNRVDEFDAAFFGFSPHDAALLDPQHRWFLEYAWKALEDSGYAPPLDALVGVFAGTSLSSYLLYNVLGASNHLPSESEFAAMIANDKDFLATRVSYVLNLRGPSLTVQTGCSTSLAAVHLACQALLTCQCDIALAGGVSIQVPQRTGYFFQPEGICSHDGHCKPFGSEASGTVFGSGLGVIVLKRVEDARKDGDKLRAIIKGSAMNNDGSAKVGYTAPSVEGQAHVIRTAQQMAGVAPDSIGYIETHGTATPLGDPIEIEALKRAFGPSTHADPYCALGAVKSNVGHLDAAAGIVGLIKTVLTLQHGLIPPLLHYRVLNPKIDLSGTPFYLNSTLAPWPSNGAPRRAGVSSFGIGGTNVHVVLEEAPAEVRTPPLCRPRLLMLSGRTEAAVAKSAHNLCDLLEADPTLRLDDVEYTLQAGRKAFPYRLAILCSDHSDAVEKLRNTESPMRFPGIASSSQPNVVFMFPGGGAQYPGMGAQLFEDSPAFRYRISELIALSRSTSCGKFLRKMFSEGPQTATAAEWSRPSIALPALFAVEFAMANFLIDLGIRPAQLIGHSLGEYTAACLAGVFDPHDALELVAFRGKLLDRLEPGAMLSASIAPEDIGLWEKNGVSLAAINSNQSFVFAGPIARMEDLAEELTAREISFRKLQINVAAHSSLVEPILDEFREFVGRLKLQPPRIPFVSNVTGTWIDKEQATDPGYWSTHLRSTVNFAAGLRAITAHSKNALIEVGPGLTLSTFAREICGRGDTVVPTMRHRFDKSPDRWALASAIGQLWVAGADIDWRRYHEAESLMRIPLPPYPFERQRYWIEASAARHNAHRPESWIYAPSWRRTVRPVAPSAAIDTWVVFLDDSGVGDAICISLENRGHTVIRVAKSSKYARLGDRHFCVAPREKASYSRLWSALKEQAPPPDRFVHTWGVETSRPDSFNAEDLEIACTESFENLLYIAQELAELDSPTPLRLYVVSSGLHAVERGDVQQPEKSPVLGLCRVLPQEFDFITVRSIDICPLDLDFSRQLTEELTSGSEDACVALRENRRWVLGEQALLLSGAEMQWRSKTGGVYLIVGGLGTVGYSIARHFAERSPCRLILTGRSLLPSPDAWPRWLAEHPENDPASKRIRRLQALEQMGATVSYMPANAADERQMRGVLEGIDATDGHLDGVVFAAGEAGIRTVKLIPEIDDAEIASQFETRARGAYVLDKLLSGRSLDFCLLISSNASYLGGLGASAYGAANAVLDAFAQSKGTPWIGTNWDAWPAHSDDIGFEAPVASALERYALDAPECGHALDQVLGAGIFGQFLVSREDLHARRTARPLAHTALPSNEERADNAPPRAASGTRHKPASTATEQTVAEVWKAVLGLGELGVTANFFDLGGNSLAGLRIVAELKKRLGIRVPIVSLFEKPTVQALSRMIDERDAPGEPQFDQSIARGRLRRDLETVHEEASI